MLLYKAIDKKIIKNPVLKVYKQRQPNKINNQYKCSRIRNF